MAQFGYYSTMDESIAMLTDVLSLSGGLEVMHDSGRFTTNEPRWFRAVTTDLVQMLEANEWFCIGGGFTRLPLGFHEGPDGRPGYWLSHAHGGPVLPGNLGRIKDIGGVPSFFPGEICYQPRYFDSVARTWAPPSEEVKAAYRAIVQRMKRHLLKRSLNKSFWITPDAWRLWREGRVRFLPWGDVQDGRADLPFPFPPAEDID